MLSFLSYIFTFYCIGCNKSGQLICSDCVQKLNPALCAKPEFKGYYIYKYNGVVREIIRSSKYKRKTFAYLKELTKLASNFLKSSQMNFENYFVISVPASKENFNKRGFNQAEMIGEVFAKEFKLKTLRNVLFRQKETGHQYDNDRRARAQSLKDAFVADTRGVPGAKILLVDDIVTTGTTFCEASKALTRAGAQDVLCLALAG